MTGMSALLKEREKKISKEKTVYMEMMGENRVRCRVTAGSASENGITYDIYGVELEMKKGPLRIKESIEDFAEDLDTAVEFSGWLVKHGTKPSEIYNAALNFLGSKI